MISRVFLESEETNVPQSRYLRGRIISRFFTSLTRYTGPARANDKESIKNSIGRNEFSYRMSMRVRTLSRSLAAVISITLTPITISRSLSLTLSLSLSTSLFSRLSWLNQPYADKYRGIFSANLPRGSLKFLATKAFPGQRARI